MVEIRFGNGRRLASWVAMWSSVYWMFGVAVMTASGADDAEAATVQPGMSRGDVIALWGEPRGHLQSGELEVLHYERGREVYLEADRVQAVAGAAPGRGQRPRLIAGDSFDERFERLMSRAESAHEFGAWDPQEPSVLETTVSLAVAVAIMLLMIVSMWRIFSKAGQPGWTSLVPVYNAVVMCWIAGKSGWWLLLLFIPFVNFVAVILLDIALARQFGKSAGFGIGLLLLPLFFLPILAFGSAEYEG